MQYSPKSILSVLPYMIPSIMLTVYSHTLCRYLFCSPEYINTVTFVLSLLGHMFVTPSPSVFVSFSFSALASILYNISVLQLYYVSTPILALLVLFILLCFLTCISAPPRLIIAPSSNDSAVSSLSLPNVWLPDFLVLMLPDFSSLQA